MRQSVWMRVLAAVLIISMLAAPVSAAARRPSPSYGTNCIVGGIISIIRDIIRDIWDDWFDVPGDEDPEPTPPEEPTDPSEPEETEPTEPGETEPEDPTEPEETLKTVLNLIEGHANTENGHLLRGVTYSLSQVLNEQSKPESTPGSLHDIKAIAIGAARAAAPSAQLNAAASSVQPMAATVNTEYGFTNWVDGGQYYIQSARADKHNSPNSYLKGAVNGVTGVPLENASLWTLDIVSSTVCYLSTEIDGTTYYLAIDSETESLKTTASNLTITTCIDNTDYVDGDGNQLQICGVKYLNQSGLTTDYRGENSGNDSGNAMWFYLVEGENRSKVTVAAADSSRDLPISVLTATAGDSQDGQDPGHVLDNDANTLWHTAYQGTSRDNHWIQFEISADYLVDGLRYQPRQNGTNGIITQYEVQVSEDGKTFRTVATGNWANNNNWKIAQFPGEHVKYVRLVSKDALGTNSNKFASAAEIRLTGTPVLFDMVYFPVTMFNYDTNDMNVATHILEIQQARDAETDLALWNGLYFSDGSPASTYNGPTGEYIEGDTTVTYTLVVPEYDENGTITNLEPNTDYLLVNKRSHKAAKVNREDQIVSDAIIDGGNAIITGDPPATKEIPFTAGTAVTEWGGGSLWRYVVQETDDGQTSTYIMSNGKYLTIQRGKAGLMETPTATAVQKWDADSNCMVFKQDTEWLSDHGGDDSNILGGWWQENDTGHPFYVYKRVSETEQTPVTGSYNLNYANHNYFQKGPNQPGMANGDLFYTGLAGEFMRSNGDIVFTVPDAGIFSYDRSKLSAENEYYDGVKNVYEFVGMPFVLKDDKGYAQYVFDSDANGVYFKDTDGDGYSNPAPGTATEYNNLQFDPGVPQYLPFDVADGSRNGWFPYNIYADRTDDGVNNPTYGTNSDEKQNLEYHFGMRADLPFSMTSNGRVKETDDKSDPIEFTFSGDDDVWIYIDGRLVTDLGGLHNRFDITINFAENTVVYFEKNAFDDNNETGSFNDLNFSTTQKLFNEGGVEGLLGVTRQEFASSENHTMQFFYLERGAGTSNCRIEFNLPMRDTLLVTKDASQSWSLEQDNVDGDGDGTLDLSPSEQESVNNINFGFTLMKLEGSYYDENGAPLVDAEFVPVANTDYFILNSGGQIVGHGSTNAEGHFFLKNGQTAKFMTDMPREGVTYYLVEDAVPAGFLTPDYQYKGVATQGFDYTGKTLDENEDEITIDRTHVSDASLIPEQELHMEAEENKSYIVTAYGSIEAIDSLHFICVNYLEHLDTAAEAYANEDIIVIDYGLPVQIDPLANDIVRGAYVQSVDIVHVALGEQNFDTDGDGIIEAEEVAALNHAGDVTGHSGTFKFHDNTEGKNIVGNRDSFTYELNKQLTEVESLTYLVKVTANESAVEGADTVDVYSQAKLYVVPATIMYYEENFSNLVEFAFGNGATAPTVMKEDAYVSPYQEPGVVGTIGDSTYGSDAAYLTDSHDSNGTSYKVDTTNGYVRFAYTFTGTGTSFFARTSAKTGYMQVLLFNGELTLDEAVAAAKVGGQEDVWYRDTYYNDTNNTDLDGESLYNIPVFTNNELHYGTYTILVTVAQAGTPGAGPNLERSGNEFYLDGIRVMQPLNEMAENEALTDKALDAYAIDGESNLVVETLRQKLITDVKEGEAVWDGENFVVLTDTNGAITAAQDYISYGPKEEVYLARGQKVTFSMKYWEPQGLKIYMGMKAPFGSIAEDEVGPYSTKLNVGNHPFTLRNAADCYYDVTDMQEKLETVYVQAMDEDENLLFTDAQNKTIYMDGDGYFWYKDTGVPFTVTGGVVIYMDENGTFRNSETGEKYEGEDKPTPVYTDEIDYYVITYSFEATDSIVALTNIKVVGNFEFIIIENNEENQEGGGTAET